MKSALDLISPGSSATGCLARDERSVRQDDARDSFFEPEGAAKPLANFGTVVDRHVIQHITILTTIQTVVGRIFASENSHQRTCYCKTHYHGRVSKMIDPFPPTAMLNQNLLCRLAIFLPIKRPPKVCNTRLHTTSTLKRGRGGRHLKFGAHSKSTCEISADNSSLIR